MNKLEFATWRHLSKRCGKTCPFNMEKLVPVIWENRACDMEKLVHIIWGN